MKDIKISNLYGLPFINAKVAAALKAKNVSIVMGVEKLFEKKPKGKTVVVDQFGKLVTCGIPVLGYQRGPTGVWHKVPNSMPDNEVTVSYPKFIGAIAPFKRENAPELDLDLMLEFQATRDYKKLAKKYEKQIGKQAKERVFKWFRRAVMDQLAPEKDADDAAVNIAKEEA